MYVIFPTHVSTKEPIWFHAFVPSQKKVRHYVTFHNTVRGKQVGEKHGRFQFVIEIAHKVIVLISISRHGFANKKLPDLKNPPF